MATMTEVTTVDIHRKEVRFKGNAMDFERLRQVCVQAGSEFEQDTDLNKIRTLTLEEPQEDEL